MFSKQNPPKKKDGNDVFWALRGFNIQDLFFYLYMDFIYLFNIFCFIFSLFYTKDIKDLNIDGKKSYDKINKYNKNI